MESILQSLHELDGVNGTIVADGSGQILAYKAHAVYDLPILQQVSRSVVSAVDSIRLLQEDWDSITAHFGEGKLLIRSLSSGGKSKEKALTLSVIADSRLNIPFAGVALRVAVSKLKATLDAGVPMTSVVPQVGIPGGALGTSNMNSAASLGSSSNAHFSSTGMGGGAAGKGSVPDVASSGLSWSGLAGSSSMATSGVMVADPASSTVLTVCTKMLAKSVGPMAKLFVKDAVRKISPDKPFSKEQSNELIAELIKHIEDPAEATQFRQNVLKSI